MERLKPDERPEASFIDAIAERSMMIGEQSKPIMTRVQIFEVVAVTP